MPQKPQNLQKVQPLRMKPELESGFFSNLLENLSAQPAATGGFRSIPGTKARGFCGLFRHG
jgi:hypothetical protein